MSGSVDGSFQNCPVTEDGQGVFCITVQGPDYDKSRLELQAALTFGAVVPGVKVAKFMPPEGATYMKVTYLTYNATHKRLEAQGSAELHVSRSDASSVSVNLHDARTGIPTKRAIVLYGIKFVTEGHSELVQQNAQARYDALNSDAFTRSLATVEKAMMNTTSNFVHWYASDICGVAIHRADRGQPSINAFRGSDRCAVRKWWKAAVDLVVCMFCAKVRLTDFSNDELDAIGMAAIAVLVGPYTIPDDRVDSRNTKWATYNENGDCDKDALTAAAIYTMLRFPLDPKTNHLFADCEVGNRILEHWKQTRGAAVMCHITATQETALGQANDPKMQGLTCGPEMGHCIWGVLPLIRGVTDSVDVDEPNLITAFTEMSNPETPKLRVLMGEATRPTTPHPNCIAKGPTPAEWEGQFKGFYPNLKYGTPNEGGWGEIKLLDSTQYPQLMQVYTAAGCCYPTPKKGGRFPSVCEVFWDNSKINMNPMSQLLNSAMEKIAGEPDMWTKGTKIDPRNERQDIGDITLKPCLLATVDKEARLCNPRQHAFQQEGSGYNANDVITIGAATFGVFKKNTEGGFKPTNLTLVPFIGQDHCALKIDSELLIAK